MVLYGSKRFGIFFGRHWIICNNFKKGLLTVLCLLEFALSLWKLDRSKNKKKFN